MKLNNQGLTLIEIIISITILAFVMVSVISITNTSLDRKDIILNEDRELLRIESAFDRIEWDFSQIYTPIYYAKEFTIDPNQKEVDEDRFKKLKANPIYLDQGRFSMPSYFGHPIPIFTQDSKQSFEFFTKGHRRRRVNSKESDFAWVRYEIRENSSEEEGTGELLELVRFYSPTQLYDNNLKLRELKPFILVDTITDFQLRFWDQKKEKYEDNLRNIENSDRLIRGFQLEITWRRENGIEEKTTRSFRTLWPYFEPEDLNELKYERVKKDGSTNNNQNTGRSNDS